MNCGVKENISVIERTVEDFIKVKIPSFIQLSMTY